MFTFRTLPARLMFADDPAEGGGGSDPTGDPAPTGDGDPDPDEGDEPAGDEPDDGADLGDKGKQALDRMKAERAAAKKEAREAKAEAEAMRAKLEGKEAEHAAEIEKQKIKDEAIAAANARILKAEIRAAAAGKLTDPADALRFLDLSDFEVGDDGEVDTAAVTEAIDNLAKSKPYLAAQGGKPGPVFESPGAHRKDAPKSQLAQADLQNMTPEQIATARAEGRLDDLLGVKN